MKSQPLDKRELLLFRFRRRVIQRSQRLRNQAVMTILPKRSQRLKYNPKLLLPQLTHRVLNKQKYLLRLLRRNHHLMRMIAQKKHQRKQHSLLRHLLLRSSKKNLILLKMIHLKKNLRKLLLSHRLPKPSQQKLRKNHHLMKTAKKVKNLKRLQKLPRNKNHLMKMTRKCLKNRNQRLLRALLHKLLEMSQEKFSLEIFLSNQTKTQSENTSLSMEKSQK